MKKYIVFASLAGLTLIIACTSQQLQQTANAAKDAANDALKTDSKPASNPLTNDEVINGLREALTVGTNNSTAFASKLDGFYKNPEIFIPFSPICVSSFSDSPFIKSFNCALSITE